MLFGLMRHSLDSVIALVVVGHHILPISYVDRRRCVKPMLKLKVTHGGSACSFVDVLNRWLANNHGHYKHRMMSHSGDAVTKSCVCVCVCVCSCLWTVCLWL